MPTVTCCKLHVMTHDGHQRYLFLEQRMIFNFHFLKIIDRLLFSKCIWLGQYCFMQKPKYSLHDLWDWSSSWFKNSKNISWKFADFIWTILTNIFCENIAIWPVMVSVEKVCCGKGSVMMNLTEIICSSWLHLSCSDKFCFP